MKKSKPTLIMAHSGEIVVPVVHADMVDRFLRNKGINLPR